MGHNGFLVNMLRLIYLLITLSTLIFLVMGQCQEPGNAVCWLAEYDLIVGDPCCTPYSACLPYPSDGSVDNFCQYLERIQEGEFCGNRVGLCANGLECISNICVASSSTSASTSASTGTGSTTSSGSCQIPGSVVGGAKCSYFSNGVDNIYWDPCCSGSECLPYDSTEEPYFKYCMVPGLLGKGDYCLNKYGICEPGLVCNDVGVCDQESAVGCQGPGNALCKIVDIWQDVGLPCCAGSECLPWLYGTPHDFYCQKKDLGVGNICTDKVGWCADGLDCIMGVCLPSAPTTTSSTTQSAPTSGPCILPGMAYPGFPGPAVCWQYPDGTEATCCETSHCDFYPALSPEDFTTMYCQYDDPLLSGEDCADKQGTCAGGAKCDASTGKCP